MAQCRGDAAAADARDIFRHALQAADPGLAVRRALRRDGHTVSVGGGTAFDLRDFDEVIVVGFGKASYPMAVAAIDVLGDDTVTGGHVVTKDDHLPRTASGTSRLADYGRVSFSEAAHPVPNIAGVHGAHTIRRLLSRAGERSLVVCVVSGGASALLCAPADGLSLEHLQVTARALLACGASIDEMNAVRKHLSAVKGGQLAGIAAPATVATLVLSDVVGDDLSVIASGPTVPDASSFADCWAIVQRYGLESGPNALPDAVLSRLRRGVAGHIRDTPKPGDAMFDKCHAHLVATNAEAVAAAETRAKQLGYNTLVLSTRVEGEAREVAKVYSAILKEIAHRGVPVKRPACILAGGETTVTIRGNGKGGRSQELALAAAVELAGTPNVALLAAGTDGTDGPTDAAGAVVTGDTVANVWSRAPTTDTAKTAHAFARQYLANNDAYSYFDLGGTGLLKTGPTGTNVMDVAVGIVQEDNTQSQA